MPVSVNMLFNDIVPLIKKVVLLNLMLIPAIRCVRNPSFGDRFQRMLIFSISDRDGDNGTLIKAVYRDGKFLEASR